MEVELLGQRSPFQSRPSTLREFCIFRKNLATQRAKGTLLPSLRQGRQDQSTVPGLPTAFWPCAPRVLRLRLSFGSLLQQRPRSQQCNPSCAEPPPRGGDFRFALFPQKCS